MKIPLAGLPLVAAVCAAEEPIAPTTEGGIASHGKSATFTDCPYRAGEGPVFQFGAGVAPDAVTIK